MQYKLCIVFKLTLYFQANLVNTVIYCNNTPSKWKFDLKVHGECALPTKFIKTQLSLMQIFMPA